MQAVCICNWWSFKSIAANKRINKKIIRRNWRSWMRSQLQIKDKLSYLSKERTNTRSYNNKQASSRKSLKREIESMHRIKTLLPKIVLSNLQSLDTKRILKIKIEKSKNYRVKSVKLEWIKISSEYQARVQVLQVGSKPLVCQESHQIWKKKYQENLPRELHRLILNLKKHHNQKSIRISLLSRTLILVQPSLLKNKTIRKPLVQRFNLQNQLDHQMTQLEERAKRLGK